jgi:hypothetical protein
MLLRPVFGVFSGEFPILYWPLFLFTPGLLKHSIQFNSPATSIITKFCRGPSVSRWRFIFPGWKFSVLSALSSNFCIAARYRFGVPRSSSSPSPRKFADSTSPAAVSVTPANTGVSHLTSRPTSQLDLATIAHHSIRGHGGSCSWQHLASRSSTW